MDYEYLLCDNAGANSLTLEIKLSIGTIFECYDHKYMVESIEDNGLIICERL